MLNMSVIDEINDPGSTAKPSEDVIGYDLDQHMGWIIDGASDGYVPDIPKHVQTGESLNAHWAAHTLSGIFKSHASKAKEDLRSYFEIVLKEFEAEYERASGSAIEDIPRHAHPIAAFAFFMYDQDSHTLNLAGLCDCKVFAQLGSGDILENTPTTDPDYERERDQQWAQEDGGQLDPEKSVKRLLDKRSRSNLYEQGGNAVLGPHPQACEKIKIETFDVAPSDLSHIMITSDGLMRLSDTFQGAKFLKKRCPP